MMRSEGSVKRMLIAVALLGATVGLALPASATTLIEDFDTDWMPGGVYGVWANSPPAAILFSEADAFHVITNGGWGGGWYVPDVPVNAAGETGFELDVTFGATNEVPVIVLGIEDVDGSFINFAWYGLPVTGSMTLSSATASNTWGSPLADIDFGAILGFHIQADGGGDPGLAADIRFENLSAVPEPATLGLLAIGGVAVLRRRK